MLIPKNKYSILFQKYQNKKILLILPMGNVGDQLIWQSCFQLLKYYKLSYDSLDMVSLFRNQEKINNIRYKNYDAIFWVGGGNMGILYRDNYFFRKQISENAKLNNLEFCILPQSWTSQDACEAQEYYAREYKSIELYEPKAKFCHDLALSYELTDDIKKQICMSPTNTIGIFFRSDKEKTLDHKDNIGDPARMCKTYVQYLLLASNYKEIHTNRLHFAIAGLLLDRKVKLYSNSYFKNQAIYESSLKQFQNIEFIK